MPERTKGGDETRKREDEEMNGEPAGRVAAANTDAPPATTTRDKGQEPAGDTQRQGQGAEED